MKRKKLDTAKALGDPSIRMLADYINALADLAQPKASIPLLYDQARLDAYQTAIGAALYELPGEAQCTCLAVWLLLETIVAAVTFDEHRLLKLQNSSYAEQGMLSQ